jgi:hypothetical protein
MLGSVSRGKAPPAPQQGAPLARFDHHSAALLELSVTLCQDRRIQGRVPAADPSQMAVDGTQVNAEPSGDIGVGDWIFGKAQQTQDNACLGPRQLRPHAQPQDVKVRRR